MRVEAASDPVWNERGRALVKYLATPRTWGELIIWGKRNNLHTEQIRNILAHIDPIFIVRIDDRGEQMWSLKGVALAYVEVQDQEGTETT
jgi:hypothetical protein